MIVLKNCGTPAYASRVSALSRPSRDAHIIGWPGLFGSGEGCPAFGRGGICSGSSGLAGSLSGIDSGGGFGCFFGSAGGISVGSPDWQKNGTI
jgi:hypothetical protein